MKTLVCSRPGLLEYKEIDEPVLRPGHAIVRIKNICVCGTDLHAFEGTQPYFNYPRVLGHELSGELAAFDNAPGFSVGEMVTIIPYFNCGVCIACRNGKPNCCVSINVCGVHSDGGMAEYLSVPAYSLVHGDHLSSLELAMVESLAIGVHGIQRAAIKEREFVLIIGAGPIGLGVVQFARLAGAEVIVMDVNVHRLSYCEKTLGVRHIVNAMDRNVSEQLRDITGGDMATVVIDATGSQKAINSGINYLAHGGRYILIGLQKEEIIISHPEFHKRESTLMSSRNATRRDFDQVIGAIKNKMIEPTSYVSAKVKFSEAGNEFANWLNLSNGLIKAAIEMD